MPAVAINEYEAIREKMGETVSLPAEKLQASEYNTRCTCIDQNHVNRLAKKIKERGFHPKRAISVNVIRGAGGSEVNYRVAAGVHRLAAAKAAELAEIPCLLYYDLNDEEECLLDRWDNEMDEDHKKIHFMEEAEHCKYLHDVKKWSYRQIGRNKGIDHKTIDRRVKIANIPEEAKMIIRGVDHDPHLFSERHFLDICKLSDPHIVTVCKEIVARAKLAEKGEKDPTGRPVHPMKQTDIKKKVDELLRLEKQGKREIVMLEPAPKQLTLFLEYERDQAQEQTFREKKVIVDVENVTEETHLLSPPFEIPETLPEIISDKLQYNMEKQSRGMHFNRCIRWLKGSGLIDELGQTNFLVLQKMIESDLWYRGNQDEPFFYGEEAEGDPFAYIARHAGIEKEHLQKRSLPSLKKEGFLDYWEEKGTYWFKVNWNKLAEVYRKKAYGIHYKEDGLKNMPEDATGVIRPTPFHYLRIEKGKVVPWNGTTPATLQKTAAQQPTASQKLDDNDTLVNALRALTPSMDDKEITICLERRDAAETALKLLADMEEEKRKAIRNEAAYVLELVRRGPKIPQGFVTPEEAQNREEKQKALNTFITTFKEKKFTMFCPNEIDHYMIIDRDDYGFTYEKEEGDYPYTFFEKWTDEKFFR